MHLGFGNAGRLVTIFLFLGGLVLFYFAVTAVNDSGQTPPPATNYAPNLWFDSEEKYFPTSPYFYTDDISQLSGKESFDKYSALSFEEKKEIFTVFYHVVDNGNEWVYEYWLYYIFNDYKNHHYHDWEGIFVFVDKSSGDVNRVIGTAHSGGIFNNEIINPGVFHIWVYIEKGSHANSLDVKPDGDPDITHLGAWCPLLSWSDDDKQNGYKISYSDVNYKLEDLDNFWLVETNYNSLPDSPKLGFFPVELFGIRFYLVPKAGGQITDYAWTKPEYTNPEKASPITIKKVTDGTKDKIATGINFGFNLAKAGFNKAKDFTVKTANLIKDTTVAVAEKVIDLSQQGLAKIGDFISSVKNGIGNIASNLQSFVAGIIPFVPDQPSSVTISTQPSTTVEVPIPSSTSEIEEPSDFYDAEFISRSPDLELNPGEETTLWAQFQNTGTTAWRKSSVSLNITHKPPSPFYHSGWLTQRRPTLLDQSSVASGGIGNFAFPVQISDSQELSLLDFQLRPVYQDSSGFNWLGSDSVTWKIIISAEKKFALEENTISEIKESFLQEESPKITERRPAQDAGEGPEETSEEDSGFFVSPGIPFPELPWPYNLGLSVGSSAPPPEDESGQEGTSEEQEEESDQEQQEEQEESQPPAEEQPQEEAPSTGSGQEPLPKILINEVQINKAEFVELYNTTDQDVDMTGWYFSYYSKNRDWDNPWRSKEFPEGTQIPTNGYYLIGVSGYPQTGGDPNSNWELPYINPFLSNSDGAVAIFPWNPKEKTAEEVENGRVDALGWGEAIVKESNNASVPAENQSLERKILGGDTDNNLEDFRINERPSPINSAGETKQVPEEEPEEEPGEPPEEESDTEPPDTILDLFPDAFTNLVTAIFSFHSTEEDSTFGCTLDSQEWQTCASPKEYDELSEGEHEFQVRAIDEAQNIDPSPAACFWQVLIEAPTPFVKLKDDYDFASKTFTILWGLEDERREHLLDYFEIQYSQGNKNNWQDLELTEEEKAAREKEFSAPQDQTTYYFRVRSYDILGNQSEWYELLVPVNTAPVVINEIAWRGTEASHLDEWIELYNSSSHEVLLDDWKLYLGQNMQHEVELSGTIPAKGFYLLERSVASREPDDTVSDISADLLYQGAISDSRTQMWLVNNLGRTIDWLDLRWDEKPKERYSMERVSPYVSGRDRYNWLPNNQTIINGLDANSEPILGTPKSQNSVYLSYTSLALTGDITEDTVFFKERSPYIVYYNLIVEEGVTLTVEPGVVIKFKNGDSYFEVRGTFISKGTSEDEIVYTSITDQDYGGWLEPTPGAWKWIKFTPTSKNSIFDYSRIRCAGSYKRGYRSNNAGIIAGGSNLVFRNSILEHIKIKGLVVSAPEVLIESSTFQENNSESDSVAVLSGGSESQITIKNSTFQNNSIGIYLKDGAEATIENCEFTGNQIPIQALPGYPILSGNTFENNSYNGVVISGKLTKDTIWHKANYFINYSIEVEEGATLEIKPGTVIKFKGGDSYLDVLGTVKSLGTEEEPIIFTHKNDNSYESQEEDSVTPGSWKWIRVLATSQDSIFEYTRIRGAGSYKRGYKSNNAALLVGGTDIVFRNSSIEYARIKGLVLSGSSSLVESSTFKNNDSESDSQAIRVDGGSSPIIKNSVFKDNNIGIYVKSASNVVIEDNEFYRNSEPIKILEAKNYTLSGNIAAGNSINAIIVSGTISQDVTWYKDLTYVVYYSLIVEEEGTLMIEPGVVVKFKNDSAYLDVKGTLKVLGSEEEPVVFTSFLDDEYGGDTDSASRTPVPGVWKWIRILGTASAESIIENATVRYAGHYVRGYKSNNAALWVSGVDITIKNLVVEHSRIRGLVLSGSDSLVEDSVFRYNNKENGSVGLYVDSSSPTVRDCSFIENTIGIYVVGDSEPIFENIYFEDNDTKTIPEDLTP